MSKPKVGVYWGASCGGCDIAVLEIHERVVELLEVAEIVF
jgi:F420-non-reducing hydrogenase small subunit